MKKAVYFFCPDPALDAVAAGDQKSIDNLCEAIDKYMK